MSNIQTTLSDYSTAEPLFTDWFTQNKTPNQYSNDEIIKLFGNGISQPDTNNATCIRHDIDCTNKELASKYFKRLSLYNTGMTNRKWRNEPYITYLLNRHLIRSLTDQLDLTQSQKSDIYPYFMGLDLRPSGVEASLTAFCVIAVKVHQDDTIRKYHPRSNIENKDEKFIEIAESLGLRKKDINREYAKHQQKMRKKEKRTEFDFAKFEKRDSIAESPVKGI